MQSPRSRGRPRGRSSAKRFGRRAALKVLGTGMGALAAAPAVRALAAPPPPAALADTPPPLLWRPLATGTAPRALDAAQFRVLEQVVERIIPATDTPGAAAAGVHWYLDDVARVEEATRRRLAEGLSRVDALAREQHGRAFTDLDEDQQEALLMAMAGPEPPPAPKAGYDAVEGATRPEGLQRSPDALESRDRSFFDFIKARVIDAYYKSEVGQIGELDWVGHEFNDTFPGVCPHPSVHEHPRPRWERAKERG